MNSRVFLIFIALFLVSNIYAYNYNIDFNKNYYYEERIDIGIKDIIDQDISYINITVSSPYETYLNYDYSLESITEVPIVFNKQVFSDINISYTFYDINESIITTEEYSLKILSNKDLPEFYLCKEENCNLETLKIGNYFNSDDDIFIITDSGNNYNKDLNYSITIDSADETLFYEENISFPYEINKNQIIGHNYYNLLIDCIDNTTGKTFVKSLSFELSENTKEEQKSILVAAVNPNIEEEQVLENTNTSEPASTSSVSQFYEKPEKSKNIYLIIGIIIFVIAILAVVFSKKEPSRRLSRKR
jgi:hypothetical protein